MGVEYAPASLGLTHNSTELYCTCTCARELSVRVAQDGVMVPVMVRVMVRPRGDVMSGQSVTCVLGSRLEHARAQCRDV